MAYSSLDTEAEEMPFEATLRRQARRRIGAGRGRRPEEREPAHQAVVLARGDWVSEVLRHDADPTVLDKDGKNALQLAGDMASRHPGVAERAEILRMVSFAYDWRKHGGVENGDS
jgi:hypothetical protein